MTRILEHIYSLTINRKACWKDACCHEYLQNLGLNEYGDIVLTECNLPTTAKEELLLKLSIIQKLYKNHIRILCVKKFDFCNSLLNDFNLLENLTNCLRLGDQLLVFSASKALSQVLQCLPFNTKNAKWFCTFLDFQTDQIKNSSWRTLYTWSVLSHLLHSYLSNKDNFEAAEPYVCDCQGSFEKFLCFNDKEMTSFMVFHVLKKIEILTFNCLSFWKDFRDIKMACDSVLENKVAGVESRCFKDFCVEVHKREIACHFFQPDFEDQFFALLSFYYEVMKCVAVIKQRYNTVCMPKLKHASTLGHVQDLTRSYMSEDCQFDERESLSKSLHCSKMLAESCYLIDNNMQLGHIEFSKADVFPLLVQCLHFKHLSQRLFQKVLDVVDELLKFAEKKSIHQENSDDIFRMNVIDTAKSFISVLNCCLWEYMPKSQGFIGFGGRVSARSPDGVDSRKCQKCFDGSSLRKVSLVLLKSLLALGNHETDILQARKAIAENLLSWAEKLKTSTAKANQKYVREDLFTGCQGTECLQELQLKDILCDLFAEQDDELIEVLFLLLQLNSKLQKRSPDFTSAANPEREERILAICKEINPHHLFLSLLQTVCFDHSVLLDFLVSNETMFLSYLVSYLHCVLNDWSAFASSFIGSADAYSDNDNDNKNSLASIEYVEGNNLSIPVNGVYVDEDILALGAKNVAEQNSDCYGVSSSNSVDSCVMDDKSNVSYGGFDSDQKCSEGHDDDDGEYDDDDDENRSDDDNEIKGDDNGVGDDDNKIDDDDDDDNKSDDGNEIKNDGNEIDGDDDDDDNGVGYDNNKIDYDDDDDDNKSDDGNEIDDDDDDNKIDNDDDDNGGDDDDNEIDDDDDTDKDDDNNESDDQNNKNEVIQFTSSILANCDSAVFPDPTYSPKQTPFRDPLEAAPFSLEKVMSVLIRLRLSIERLTTAGLFPYSPKPLVRLLLKVESVYEEC